MSEPNKDQEPGDQDFERFIRENSPNPEQECHICIPFPLVVLREKIKAIQNIYSATLNIYKALPMDDPLKGKLLVHADAMATAACETFDQFNFILIDDDDDDDDTIIPGADSGN